MVLQKIGPGYGTDEMDDGSGIWMMTVSYLSVFADIPPSSICPLKLAKSASS